MSDFKDFLDKVLGSMRDEEAEQALPVTLILPFKRFTDPEDQHSIDVIPTDELYRCDYAIASLLLANTGIGRVTPTAAACHC